MSAESIAQPDATLAVLDDPIEQGRFTRWISGADGERLAESSLQLGGMHCAACAGIIESALTALPGVRSARVSAAAERATVCWDPLHTRPAVLIEAVRTAGYDAVPDAAAPARELRRRAHRQALWRLFVAGFCAMQVMMMATPSYVAGPGELADDLRQLLNWGSWLLSLPVLLFAAGPFFRGAWQMLRHGRIGIDVPVSLGIAITFIASSGATFDPGGLFGHEVYFETNNFLMIVLILLAVLFGGLVEIVPRFFQKSTTQPVEGLKPYTALQLAGRDVYIREGCYDCHSQMIRPFRAETLRYGPFSTAGEFVYDHPFQWGSKRTGPDLHRVGGKYSDEWHRIHLVNPRDVVPESNMPAYPWLEKTPVAAAEMPARMKALRSVGVPYTDEQIARAGSEVKGKSEMDALIAYLQSLGLALK